jgi:hypothetical protein
MFRICIVLKAAADLDRHQLGRSPRNGIERKPYSGLGSCGGSPQPFNAANNKNTGHHSELIHSDWLHLRSLHSIGLARTN